MSLIELKRYWMAVDPLGAVTVMRRDDFAALRMPAGPDARAFAQSVRMTRAGDPSDASINAIFDALGDSLVPINPEGFLPLSIFFRIDGENLTARDVAGVMVLPTEREEFEIVLHGPKGRMTATTASERDEAHRLGDVLARRFKAELVDLAAMYHSPWVEAVLGGKTTKGFAAWLSAEVGDFDSVQPQDFICQGWMHWSGEDRPFWAPQGVANPIDDLSIYPSKQQCIEDVLDLLMGDDAPDVVPVRIVRGTGAIQVLDENSRAIFREISRDEYYREFGMQLPAGVGSTAPKARASAEASLEP